MFPLLAPKFSRLRKERDEDSITTLHVWLLVATTFIFTFSENGDSHAPWRASTMNRSLLQEEAIQTAHDETEQNAETDDGVQFLVHDFENQSFHLHYVHTVDAVFDDTLDVE